MRTVDVVKTTKRYLVRVWVGGELIWKRPYATRTEAVKRARFYRKAPVVLPGRAARKAWAVTAAAA